MLDLILNYNYGYQWYSNKNVNVKGYLFDENNELFSNENLIDYFSSVKDIAGFKKKVSNANGLFSVIVNVDNSVFFACDKTRTFPLFYTQFNHNIMVSDDSYAIKKNFRNGINTISEGEFLASSFVSGSDTLLKGVFQVQAGEIVEINDGECKPHLYHSYCLTQGEIELDESQNKIKLLNILERVTARLIRLAKGRQIVLPLSGGYDSRLLAALLKKNQYENVICFTYGSKDSPEVLVSEKVAKELGFQWYFVEYTESTIPSDYPDTKIFKDYYKFASNHTSVFMTQDYFAVKYLYENDVVEKGAIFAPGHSGDFLAGSHLVADESLSRESLTESIVNKHYFQKKVNDLVKNKITQLVSSEDVDVQNIYSLKENFNFKERQAKFIVNANRVYEYFGFKHALPLWDSELIDFFKHLPLEYKYNCALYNDVIFDSYFKPLDIPYEKPKPSTSLVKVIVRKYIPKYIKDILIHWLSKDTYRLSLIHSPLEYQLIDKFYLSNINGMLAEWYIQEIKNEE